MDTPGQSSSQEYSNCTRCSKRFKIQRHLRSHVRTVHSLAVAGENPGYIVTLHVTLSQVINTMDKFFMVLETTFSVIIVATMFGE